MVIFNALLNLRELKELYSGKPVCVCPLYKGSIGTTKRFETSGNPVVIPKYVALEKLNVEFLPKQEGTGDPSPDNVRPITGWESLQVTRCGNNLIDIPKIDQSKPGETAGARVFVKLATTITISADYSSVEITKNIWRFQVGFLNGSLQYAIDDQLNGNTSSYMTFKGSKENPITSIVYRNTYITSGELFNIMCNIGSTPEPYEPYQGNDYTLALPETIYGGTVDAVTGAGSKTWDYIASYNGESLPGEWVSDRDVYAPGTTPTTGAQVAYKLDTPEPFEVTKILIPSLRNENTIFTNGENMDIIYKENAFWSDEA